MKSKQDYLSSVFNYLYRHKKIEKNPMDMVEPMKCCIKVKKPLSDEEMERIRVACEKQKPAGAVRNVAIIDFMIDSGVRVSELCKINLSDVDFANRQCKVLGKGNKERYVYFSPRTMVRLQEYLKTREDIQCEIGRVMYRLDTPLFASLDKIHKRLKKEGIECMMRKLGKEAGVFRLHPHLLRATFATKLAKRGVDINIIAKALGHSNLGSINRYVLLSDEQVNDMLRGIGSVA